MLEPRQVSSRGNDDDYDDNTHSQKTRCYYKKSILLVTRSVHRVQARGGTIIKKKCPLMDHRPAKANRSIYFRLACERSKGKVQSPMISHEQRELKSQIPYLCTSLGHWDRRPHIASYSMALCYIAFPGGRGSSVGRARDSW